MFGGDNSSIQTMLSMEGRIRRLEEALMAIEQAMHTTNNIHQAKISDAKRKNKLLMDYLNVRIESGDRIVPKDNAQG